MREKTGKTTSHVAIVDKELLNEASCCKEKVQHKDPKGTGKTISHAGIVEKELQNEAAAGIRR